MSPVSTIVAILMLCLAVVTPAFAQEADEGFEAFDVAGLEKQSVRVGGIAMDVYAGRSVDVQKLVGTVRKGDSAQTIYDKVNAVRQELYPEDQIILSVGGSITATLVRFIAWWNNYNPNGNYWYAQYISSSAVLVTSYVIGTYRIYDRVGTGNWVLRYTVRTDGAYTRGTYGTNVLRGFKGQAVGNAQADVVMWFFR